MNKTRRHAGRAIRKQRRRHRETMAALMRLADPLPWQKAIAQFAMFGGAAKQFGDAFNRAWDHEVRTRMEEK